MLQRQQIIFLEKCDKEKRNLHEIKGNDINCSILLKSHQNAQNAKLESAPGGVKSVQLCSEDRTAICCRNEQQKAKQSTKEIRRNYIN